MPTEIRSYMATWGRVMPEWKIERWDEERMDQWAKGGKWLNEMPRYVKEAYEAKKYAFVSDYVRLLALKEMGGVYMDVDVEVVRSLDGLEELRVDGSGFRGDGFLGFEENKFHAVGTCVIGSEKGSVWLDEQIAYYQNRPFRLEDDKYDVTTNTVIMTTILERYGLKRNGEEQEIVVNDGKERESRLKIYDFHHFSPLTSTRVMRANEHTYTVHHYAESWRHISERRPYRKPVVNEVINAMVQAKRWMNIEDKEEYNQGK